MKILVTGGGGQLAGEIRDVLESGGADIGSIDSAYKGAEFVFATSADLDITDNEAVHAFILDGAYDYVINCAAATNVDGCESNPELAELVNARGPEYLSKACQESGAVLLHVSTDYVFAGNESTPLLEDSACAPVSVYGKTKLAGEVAIRKYCSRFFIMRTAWLYGQHGANFVKTVLRLSTDHKVMTVVDDQIGGPTNANDLAYEILKVLLTKDYGVYHCTGNGSCSWYDFASEIVHLAGADMRIEPCSSKEYAAEHPLSAPRPAFSILDNRHLRMTVGDDMRPWQPALESFINHIRG